MNERDENEAKLLGKAKDGDIKALEALISQYEKLIYNIAYRIMGDYDDALDMSQEAMIKIYRNLGKCADISHFRRWIYMVTNNCCIDELRKRKNRSALSMDDALDTEDGVLQRQFISAERTPEQRLVQKELSQDLQKAINHLSAEHKSVIVLRDINGLSYDELAETLHCNVGTVKSRLSRARLRLKTILTKTSEQNGEPYVISGKNQHKANSGGRRHPNG